MTFSEWIDARMSERHIRTVRLRAVAFFAQGLDVSPGEVVDWALGNCLPSDRGYRQLALSFGIAEETLRAFPLRRQSSRSIYS